MKVLGGLRLGEGGSVDNMTLPVGSDFPDKENVGELFYLKGNPDKSSGVYICEEDPSIPNGLTWRILINIDSEELRTQLIELGSTRPLFIYSANAVAVRWDFQSKIDTGFFEHTTVAPDSSKVKILRDGFYQVTYTLNSAQEKNSSQLLKCFVRLNGRDVVGRSITNSWSQGSDHPVTNTTTFVARLYTGDVIEVMAQPKTFRGKLSRVYTVDDSCGLAITRIGEI